MNNSVFGEVSFNMGWERKLELKLFKKTYTITVNAKAYYDTDEITEAQEKAFKSFMDELPKKTAVIENMLLGMSKGSDKLGNYTPSLLLFQRDGSYALLFNNKAAETDEIAVCLSPEEKIIAVDSYL